MTHQRDKGQLTLELSNAQKYGAFSCRLVIPARTVSEYDKTAVPPRLAAVVGALVVYVCAVGVGAHKRQVPGALRAAAAGQREVGVDDDAEGARELPRARSRRVKASRSARGSASPATSWRTAVPLVDGVVRVAS